MCLPCPFCPKCVMQDKEDIPRASSPSLHPHWSSRTLCSSPSLGKLSPKGQRALPQLLAATSLPSPRLSLLPHHSYLPVYLLHPLHLSGHTSSRKLPIPTTGASFPSLPPANTPTLPPANTPTTSPPPVDAGPTASQIFSPRFRLKLLRDQDPSSPAPGSFGT